MKRYVYVKHFGDGLETESKFSSFPLVDAPFIGVYSFHLSVMFDIRHFFYIFMSAIPVALQCHFLMTGC